MSGLRARRVSAATFESRKAHFLGHLAEAYDCPEAQELRDVPRQDFRKFSLAYRCAVHGVANRTLDTLWTRHTKGKVLCAECEFAADPVKVAKRKANAQQSSRTKLARTAHLVQSRLDRQFGEGALVLDAASYQGYNKPAKLVCSTHAGEGAFSWTVCNVTLARWSPCSPCRARAAAKTQRYMPGVFGARTAGAQGPWAGAGDGGWLYEIIDAASSKRYVGITHSTPETRLKQHLFAARAYKGSSEFRALLRARPEEFSIQPIAYFQHRWALAEAERLAIVERGTQVPNGYNKVVGGSTLSLDRFRGVKLQLCKLGLSPDDQRKVYKALRGELPGAISEQRVIIDRLSAGTSLHDALHTPVRPRAATGTVIVLGVTYRNLRAACLAHGLDWTQTRKEATRNGFDFGKSIEARLSGKLKEIDNRLGDKVRHLGELYPSLCAACTVVGIKDGSVRARAKARALSIQDAFDSFLVDAKKVKAHGNNRRNARALDSTLAQYTALTTSHGLKLAEADFLRCELLSPLSLSCPKHGAYSIGMGVARKKLRAAMPVCSVCSKLASLTPAALAGCLVHDEVRWFAHAGAFNQAGVLPGLGVGELVRHRPSQRQAIFDELAAAVARDSSWSEPLERAGRGYPTAQHAVLEADASLLNAIRWTQTGLSVKEAIEQLLLTGCAPGAKPSNRRKTLEFRNVVYRSMRALCDAIGIDRRKVESRVKQGLSVAGALSQLADEVGRDLERLKSLTLAPATR